MTAMQICFSLSLLIFFVVTIRYVNSTSALIKNLHKELANANVIVYTQSEVAVSNKLTIKLLKNHIDLSATQYQQTQAENVELKKELEKYRSQRHNYLG